MNNIKLENFYICVCNIETSSNAGGIGPIDILLVDRHHIPDICNFSPKTQFLAKFLQICVLENSQISPHDRCGEISPHMPCIEIRNLLHRSHR